MSAHVFLGEFFRDWKSIGAVAPSSRGLARRITEAAGAQKASRILELGPGTGAFTEAIAEVMHPEARYLGVEVNDCFTHRLRQRFPQMRFECACAQQVDFAGAGFGDGFDAVISGLPWTAFSGELQHKILSNVVPHMTRGSRFVSFAYFGLHKLPSGQRFRALLKRMLPDVKRTGVVWSNLPPAFVYVAKKD